MWEYKKQDQTKENRLQRCPSAVMGLLSRECILNTPWKPPGLQWKDYSGCFALFFKDTIHKDQEKATKLDGLQRSKRSTGWKSYSANTQLPNIPTLLPWAGPAHARPRWKCTGRAQVSTAGDSLPPQRTGCVNCRVSAETGTPHCWLSSSRTLLPGWRSQPGRRQECLLSSEWAKWPFEKRTWKYWHRGLPNQRSTASHCAGKFRANEPLPWWEPPIYHSEKLVFKNNNNNNFSSQLCSTATRAIQEAPTKPSPQLTTDRCVTFPWVPPSPPPPPHKHPKRESYRQTVQRVFPKNEDTNSHSHSTPIKVRNLTQYLLD